MRTLHKNMKQVDAVRAAQTLGAEVRFNGKTRLLVTHPAMRKPFELSAHRRDVAQSFLSWLRRLKEKTEYAIPTD